MHETTGKIEKLNYFSLEDQQELTRYAHRQP